MSSANKTTPNTRYRLVLLDRGRHVTEKASRRESMDQTTNPPATWNIIYGEYKESLRLCFLPADEKGEHGYWFGFESEIQKASPVFKART